jgi:hypothetical protein
VTPTASRARGIEITVLKDEKPEAPEDPPPAPKKTLEPA